MCLAALSYAVRINTSKYLSISCKTSLKDNDHQLDISSTLVSSRPSLVGIHTSLKINCFVILSIIHDTKTILAVYGPVLNIQYYYFVSFLFRVIKWMTSWPPTYHLYLQIWIKTRRKCLQVQDLIHKDANTLENNIYIFFIYGKYEELIVT